VTALDPRAPLVLDTHDLARRPGTSARVSREVPAPESLGTAFIAVPTGSPLALELLLESVREGVLVTGTVSGAAAGECARCLDPIVVDVDADITELFTYPDIEPYEGEDADEVRSMEGEFIDLEPTLRDAVVLTMPLSPLCTPDCPGLCPECGQRLADEPGHSHDVTDARWAALSGLLAADAESDDSADLDPVAGETRNADTKEG
jgi:uncharacterized protein